MNIEYYLTELNTPLQRRTYQLKDDQRLFKIAKFKGEDQPENIYFVKMTEMKDSNPVMECDCPNKRRGAHINDKHGQMTAKWLLLGKPNGYFDEKGEWHGSASLDDAGDFEKDEGHEEHS